MLRVAVGRVVEPAAGEQAMPAWLGESERRRWPRLGPGVRPAFVASRALLRELLQSATGLPAAAWDVSAEAGRAPLASSSAAVCAVHVSLSHRLGWVAAAVADVPVGVDIECDRPARSDPGERAALMLSPGELIAWRSVAADERETALLARWTAKEAWSKSCPPQAAPWDFRRVHASARAPADARANVRTWRAAPVHVALCCGDAVALAAARCEGLPTIAAEASWHVAAVALPH
ncbi:MAG: 4'-phosphopantetheinyl transferase superfamily protein [Burkholderiales bacterium]|nr:4'-phosphopantetheinyl transferase superfamily protein [Burkholderiales bacterium]